VRVGRRDLHRIGLFTIPRVGGERRPVPHGEGASALAERDNRAGWRDSVLGPCGGRWRDEILALHPLSAPAARRAPCDAPPEHVVRADWTFDHSEDRSFGKLTSQGTAQSGSGPHVERATVGERDHPLVARRQARRGRAAALALRARRRRECRSQRPGDQRGADQNCPEPVPKMLHGVTPTWYAALGRKRRAGTRPIEHCSTVLMSKNRWVSAEVKLIPGAAQEALRDRKSTRLNS